MLEKDNRLFIIEMNNEIPIGVIGFKNLGWVNRNSELFIYRQFRVLGKKGMALKLLSY